MRALPLIAPTAVLLAALLSGCASGPSPTQIRLDNLDARVTKIERVVSNGSLVQLAQEQASLQAQLRDLRGRLDSLAQSNRHLSRQQHDLYADLNKRLSALERSSAAQQAAIQSASAAAAGSGGASGSGAGGSSGASAGSSAPSGGAASGAGGAATGGSLADMLPGVTPTQQSVYEQAFGALKAGSYSVAIRGFAGFLKTYPTSPLAPNAEYWLGEAHYVNQDFNQAEKCFRAVLKKWPDSGKAPAALFDLGNTLIAQGKVRAGRATLKKVTQRYPGTDLALRAATTLGQGRQ